VTCTKCKTIKPSQQFETTSFFLRLKKTVRQQLDDHFLNNEYLQEVVCDKCPEKTTQIQKYKMLIAPEILIIQVNR
jgi:uncharacterized UBP type Zn finger protein